MEDMMTRHQALIQIYSAVEQGTKPSGLIKDIIKQRKSLLMEQIHNTASQYVVILL